MAEQEGSIDVERIVFEPTQDGTKWKMRLEGGDVEGHSVKGHFRSMEPAGEDDATGETLYRVSLSLDGDDVEAHAYKGHI